MPKISLHHLTIPQAAFCTKHLTSQATNAQLVE